MHREIETGDMSRDVLTVLQWTDMCTQAERSSHELNVACLVVEMPQHCKPNMMMSSLVTRQRHMMQRTGNPVTLALIAYV